MSHITAYDAPMAGLNVVCSWCASILSRKTWKSHKMVELCRPKFLLMQNQSGSFLIPAQQEGWGLIDVTTGWAKNRTMNFVRRNLAQLRWPNSISACVWKHFFRIDFWQQCFIISKGITETEKSCCHFFCLVPVSLSAWNRWRHENYRNTAIVKLLAFQTQAYDPLKWPVGSILQCCHALMQKPGNISKHDWIMLFCVPFMAL